MKAITHECLQRVVKAVNESGALLEYGGASYEYPVHINVDCPGVGFFSFGFANGPFGWDLHTENGACMCANESPLDCGLAEEDDIENLSAYLIGVVLLIGGRVRGS